MATTLSDYLAETRRLLHDSGDGIFPLADKIANVNRAIRMRDILTGAQRQVFEFNMVAGTETYSFTTIGGASIFDVVGLYVINGTERVPLDPRSFSDMNETTRRYSPVNRGLPQQWTRYGATAVLVAPAPSLAYEAEADCAIYTATPLAALSDADALDYPYTEPVPYHAAYLCRRNERQTDEAQEMLDEFHRLIAVLTGIRTGTAPVMYGVGR
jgi:hypothetical protein